MNNEKRLNDIFMKVKNQDQSSSFQETKALFLTSQGLTIEATKNKRFTLKKLLIMIGIVGLMTSVAIYFGTNVEAQKVKTRNAQEQVKIEDESEDIAHQGPIENGEILDVNLAEVNDEVIENLDVWESIPSPVGFQTPIYAPRRDPKTDLNVNKDQFIFPTLTKKEIQATLKQKNKMLKALAKNDDKVYKYVPAGSFTYKSKVVSVQSFIMMKSEVSNLEYKTFLFDLLIQGRKSEFKTAAPSQEKWTELFGEKMRYMQENYFSDHDHDRFPVCNISPEGAEMYCKWLTLELDKSDYAKRMKMRLNDVRVPQRVEWVKAVSNEGENSPYPWKGDVLADSTGFFYANFKLPKKDTSMYLIADSTSLTTLGSLLGSGNILLYAEFHREHEEGLFNTCGNVAELVHETDINTSDLLTRNNKVYGTAGGGWMNTGEEIKILNEDLHKGIKEGHPNVGFRVVMTYTSNDAPLVGKSGKSN